MPVVLVWVGIAVDRISRCHVAHFQGIEESHRSIHDALMIAKRGAGDARVVGGGGAVEMELSRDLRARALEVHGKDQLIMLAIAKALEIIPTQLAMNSGFDP